MIDRQFDQLGKVLVCVSAVTIRHRGRATRSIDHNTHGHRLGQDQAQAGFEGSQEAGALDEEVAIASTPSRVRLVSSLLIDWVDDIEIILGLLRGVQVSGSCGPQSALRSLLSMRRLSREYRTAGWVYY